jgi:hypothetical protein
MMQQGASWRLFDRIWILFERRLHPLLYDSLMQLAENNCVSAVRIQHIVSQENGFPLVAEGAGVAILTKPGALLLARNGVIVRPLAERTF